MLRITKIQTDGHPQTLSLEGKLLAEWIGELGEACRAARANSRQLQLDLSGLQFVDAAGIITLRELVRQGIDITAMSPLVAEMLKEI